VCKKALQTILDYVFSTTFWGKSSLNIACSRTKYYLFLHLMKASPSGWGTLYSPPYPLLGPRPDVLQKVTVLNNFSYCQRSIPVNPDVVCPSVSGNVRNYFDRMTWMTRRWPRWPRWLRWPRLPRWPISPRFLDIWPLNDQMTWWMYLRRRLTIDHMVYFQFRIFSFTVTVGFFDHNEQHWMQGKWIQSSSTLSCPSSS